MENNTEAITARIYRWIDNARRNISNYQEELARPDCVTPLTYTSRISELYAMIQAWNEVLTSIGHERR